MAVCPDMHGTRLALITAVGIGLALGVPAVGRADEGGDGWCAPELETLANEVCAFVPAPATAADGGSGKRTLVIFLHGVVKPDTTWQHAQHRAILRAAKTHDFAVVAPRGRRGVGPKGMTDWWTWPTSARAQREVEASVIDEWTHARSELEKRAARVFDEVFVFGFSNGAFYGSSLALRGRLTDVDGYAVFAGGSAPEYLRRRAAKVARRPPVFVGIGKKDRYREDGRQLARALRRLGWTHRTGERNVGHVMADSQVREAVDFLRRERGPRR